MRRRVGLSAAHANLEFDATRRRDGNGRALYLAYRVSTKPIFSSPAFLAMLRTSVKV